MISEPYQLFPSTNGEGPEAATWADRIRPHLVQTIESIIAAGRELTEAKAALLHGQFGPLLDELGMSPSLAARFMRVASHPVLSDVAHVPSLPAAIGTLDELTRWDPDELADAIAAGDVGPDTTRADAEAGRPPAVPGPQPYDEPLSGPGEAEAIVDELQAAHGDDVTKADVERAVDECVESKRDPAPPPGKPDLGGGISHPARYSLELLPLFDELLEAYVVPPGRRVLDPFAGTGRIHELHPSWETVGIELEPEWAELHDRTQVGDALELPFAVGHFDAIVTSPCYGNRLADSHNASDPERRRSYTHDLGRDVSDSSAGAMHWQTSKLGDEASGSADYRRFHERAWVEAARVLGHDGLFILNIKDHIRDGNLQQVMAWHCWQLARLGFRWLESRSLNTPGLRMGANRERTVEMVQVFRKGSR